MKKALIVSTVSRQFTLFERGNIGILKELGYEVHCAANYSDATDALDELDIIRHQIDIERSPFSIKQIKAYSQLKKLMREQAFDLVHCHAPMGGVLGRLSARATKAELVLYTAHGFHFYKGAPAINNLVYKAIEKFMARFTDVLITMNNEDYEAALKFKLRKNGEVVKIPGVGVDTEFIKNISVNREEKRRELNIPIDAFLMLSVGELIPRKNHIQAIKALVELVNKENKKDIYYAICGRGILLEELESKVKELGIEKNVKFLGYRTDVYEIMKVSDVFVFPSFQEGLPKAVMEAMASGLPIVASKIRGNVDLIINGDGGKIFDLKSDKELRSALSELINNSSLKCKLGEKNIQNIGIYDLKNVNQLMKKIYLYSSGGEIDE